MLNLQKKEALLYRNAFKKSHVQKESARIFYAAFFSAVLFLTSIGICERSYALDTARASSFIYHGMNVSHDSGAYADFKNSPSPVQADPCLPLLKKVGFASNRNQRPAGTQAAPAVALGLVFGLRVALGPKETLKDRSSVRTSLRTGVRFSHEILAADDGQKSALSIANYRRCKNQVALKELNVKKRFKGSR